MEKIKYSKDLTVNIHKRMSTFEHSAGLKIVFDYSDAYERSRDQDAFEEAMQQIARKLQNVMKKIGAVTMPANEQFDGEIIMRVAFDDDDKLREGIRLMRNNLTMQSAIDDGSRARWQEDVRQKRIGAVTQALEEFKGQPIDDGNMGQIAERVMERLRDEKKSRGAG